MKTDEYLYFVDRAFDGMLSASTKLGDAGANTVPPLPGANSVWAITYHCCALVEFWVGHIVLGRESNRDRESEFGASGTVAELARMVAEQRTRLAEDLAAVDPAARLAHAVPEKYRGDVVSVDGVLLHVLEELAQHHGQIEITRDLLLSTSEEAR
ncbi:DinB family protein [Rhodococcus sp. 7Tela_A2]|uniref:DinB family protein n=1 Tax=Rhodococcus sp. 7Tela_A2 TaxID=3093744 RepID=UPI003BB754F0